VTDRRQFGLPACLTFTIRPKRAVNRPVDS
jgi:hypothetical protein